MTAPRPVELPGAGDLPSSGDLVVTVGPTHDLGRARGLPWIRLGAGAGGDGRSDSWTVWHSAPSAAWAGYRLAPVGADALTGWFVGEQTGGDGRAAAAAVLAAQQAGDVAQADRLAAALNGSWLLLARGGDGCWHAWSDRFATVHGFVAHSGRRWALGTCQAAVAAAVGQGDLDWEALSAWCALGFFPGDRTADRNVQVIRPASHLVCDPQLGTAVSSRTWWWERELDHARSVGGTVAAFDDVLAEVLGEQAAGLRVALPISGGLDSRTAVAVLTAHEGRRAGAELWGYSYGYEASSIETRIAAQIAEARELDFRSWVVEPYLLAQLDRAARVLEGAQDLTKTRQLAVIDQVAGQADRVIGAHWGDVWLDDMGFGGSEPGVDAVLASVRRKFVKPGGDWLLRELCRLHLADPDSAVDDLLHEEFAPYRSVPGADAQARAFKTDQWSFRWTVPSLRAYHAGLPPRLPFYDGRTADLLLTVPPELLAGRYLQAEHLRRTAPDLARITWQESGTDLNHLDWSRSWLLPTRVVRGVSRRLRRSLLGSQVLSRNWEVQFGAGGEHGLASLLGPGSPVRELMPGATIDGMLADMQARPHDGELGYIASTLVTLAAWLERR